MIAQQGAQAVAQAERGAMGAESIFPGPGLKAKENRNSSKRARLWVIGNPAKNSRKDTIQRGLTATIFFCAKAKIHGRKLCKFYGVGSVLTSAIFKPDVE